MRMRIRVELIAKENVINNEIIKVRLNDHFIDMTVADAFNLHSQLGYLLEDLEACRTQEIIFEQGDIVR